MGMPIFGAMQQLSARNPGGDVRLLTSALELHRQTGGQLAVVLERMATTLRARERYRGQIRAITTAGRFTATVLACAAPLLLAYLLYDREYSHSLFETETGKQCLIAVGVLEAVGLLWLFALLRPEA
jgi:tight adherence protein B